MHNNKYNGKINSTGDILDEYYVLEDYDIDKYTVTVKLSVDRRFIGIEQVSVKKSFINFTDIINQKISFKIEYPIIEEEK